MENFVLFSVRLQHSHGPSVLAIFCIYNFRAEKNTNFCNLNLHKEALGPLSIGATKQGLLTLFFTCVHSF